MTKRVTTEALADWLRNRDDVALFGHVSPDGDAVGSTLGLWYALKAMGKRAAVCLPGGVPGLYAHLPGAEAVLDADAPLPFAPQTALAVDVSDLPRLGEAGIRAFEACPYRAVLDHHGTNAGFGELMLLDGKAADAGEMVVALIDALGVTLTREMAECLFVAISTDCGHFNFTNTRPQTFEAAARCAAAGIDIEAITSRLYRTRSFARTKLLGLVLAGLRVSDDGCMAWAKLTEAMLREAGALPEDNEGIVNYLLEIEGVQFAALANERGGQTKLSLRSKPPM
ncbi:MAG: DHH family phosphoesterase, partial [Clostridia bacterium]|nr:DHH family phosphoesterase [Clostridia bacterium]